MDLTGNLIVIGGKEDKKGEKKILREVVRKAGGKSGYLLIITTATLDPEKAGETYREIFLELGIRTVEILNIKSRKMAQDAVNIEKIKKATGIFFTGGDQLRITSILGGTGAGKALHETFKKGALLAGTSAGASVMSQTMIVGGKEEDPPGKSTVKLAPGLGFLEGVVIDQHFAQRGRIGRLISAVAQNPTILGIGIDEDTAIVMESRDRFRVLGRSTVTVVDGRNITYSNISELAFDQPLALSGVILHSLPEDYGLDLWRRQVLLPQNFKKEREVFSENNPGLGEEE